jgi:hypothetical protein
MLCNNIKFFISRSYRSVVAHIVIITTTTTTTTTFGISERPPALKQDGSNRHVLILGLFNEAFSAHSLKRLGYGLNDRGSRFRVPAGAENFSLHHCVQNGSRANPASYPMGTVVSFSGGKAAEA